MDNLIEYGPNASVTGKSLYARIADTSAQWWNGATFENYTSGDYASYAIALTEQAGGGYFTAATPSTLPAGTYTVVIQLQAGGSAAPSDTSPTGAGSCGFHAYWDGTGWYTGPAYVDELPSPAPAGYGPAAAAGTTAVTDLAGGSSRNPSIMTVQDNASQPIQGATVTAYNDAAYGVNPATAAILQATATNAAGGWTLNIPTGEGAVALVVAATGEITQVLRAAFTV